MSNYGQYKKLGVDYSESRRKETKTSAKSIKEMEDAFMRVRTTPKDSPVWKRISQLVDHGSFLDFGSLYNPEDNPEGTVGCVTGLAKICGRCVCVIASDPKIHGGSWLPGHPEKIFRIQDLAELLHVPIVWLLECSGLNLKLQDRVYTGRRGGGKIFTNNARMAKQGIPIVTGIFGTNVAGGGYHAISSTKRFAHKDTNMAVGGAAILSGMESSSKDFSVNSVDKLLKEVDRINKIPPPGSTAIHGKGGTGFFDDVFETEEAVIDAMRKYVATLEFDKFVDVGVVTVHSPFYDDQDGLYHLLPYSQKETYEIENVIARLVDDSAASEYLPGYGPEIYCGASSIDGCPVGIIANRQGLLTQGYSGVGGKLYQQGLIKMCKFVSEHNDSGTPIIWFQDTTGIAVGDEAESTGVLGLGQALNALVETADIPMATVILRKGHAASHYIECGPMHSTNALTIGTVLTEIMVMDAKTAAMAAYGRTLNKVCAKDRTAVIAKMNSIVNKYHETASPRHVAKQGIVDEVVRLPHLRRYLSWFINAAYTPVQNTKNLWTLSRIVEESYNATKK